MPRVDKLRRNQRAHQYLLEKPLSFYAEAIRSVFTAVRHGDLDQPPKVMLVTSSLPDGAKRLSS